MMSSEQQEKAPRDIRAVAAVEPPIKRRAPTLYFIIVFKLIKGLLCVALALLLYHEAKKDLSDDWDKFLKSPFASTVIREFKIHPESRFFKGLADDIALLTEAKVHRAALGALLLSLFPLVEGIGLLFRAPWAGWLAIGESAFFLPIELYELVNNQMARPDTFPWSIFAVMVINLIIVWYLYENREVLFHHHHRAPRHPGGS